uniref:Dynein light chain n=1 Tax=Ditylenchus dipsaci TaxID=166011 RepID=A0A915DN87_9BILA
MERTELGDPRFTVQVIDIDNKKVLHAQKLCREVFTNSSNEDSAEQSERKPNKQHHMEQKLAKHLKHNFEKSYGGVWHCVVGTSYGAFVTQRKAISSTSLWTIWL